MKKILIYFLSTLVYFHLTAQIRVSPNGHFLAEKSGQPFFWLGDTDWELFHRLNREQTIEFLNIRQKQGFNVIQAVALAEFGGLGTPNRYGDLPLVNMNPGELAVTPGNDTADSVQYDYWDHVDFVIQEAAKRGLYIGLLPTWGDKVAHLWGDGPIIFDSVNAEIYATTLARRYSHQWNIIWILGGDRPGVYKSSIDKKDSVFDDRPIWRAMARGIHKVLGDDVFITYHPSGSPETITSKMLGSEKWLSMNAMQSGHGARETDVWNWIAHDYNLVPAKPTLDMEPCYEDHPVNPWDGKWTKKRGYFRAYDVRLRIYRGLFSGACGVTYGDHQVWQFLDSNLYAPINIGDTIIGWERALHSEAARQMQYLKNLLLSRPFFSRIPDQSLIISDPGSTYLDYVAATRDSTRSYAMIHLPNNQKVTIDLGKISGSKKNISWYDPKSGMTNREKPVRSNGSLDFIPPKEDQDWVLIIDDASKNYQNP